MHHSAQLEPWKQAKDKVNMVRHDAPGEQPVALVVKEVDGLLN
jgi:predicted methyltransferase